MGKICYRPKKERKTYEEELLENVETVETIQEEERYNYLEEATKEPVEETEGQVVEETTEEKDDKTFNFSDFTIIF